MQHCSRKVLLSASFCSVLTLASCGPNVSDRNIKLISLEQVRIYHVRQRDDEKAKIMVLIDPRASSEFRLAHLPDARNMHLPDFKRGQSRDPEIESFQNIVVYGQHPGDSYAPGVTKRLLELGYSGVYFYAGGLDEWARLYNVETLVAEETPDP